MSGVVAFQAEIGQQRCRPGRLGMGCQEAGEAGEVVRTAALGVAEQGGSEGGVLAGRRLSTDGNQRLLENAGAEQLLYRRTHRELQPRFWRFDFRQGAIREERRGGWSSEGACSEGQRDERAAERPFESEPGYCTAQGS